MENGEILLTVMVFWLLLYIGNQSLKNVFCPVVLAVSRRLCELCVILDCVGSFTARKITGGTALFVRIALRCCLKSMAGTSSTERS